MGQHGWVLTIVFGALGAGLGTGTAVGFAVGFRKGFGCLFDEAPGPTWSFDSWATNITAAGAAFGTVLTSTTLAATAKPLNPAALASLNLFFGLLVLAGPFIFQCIRNPRKSPVNQDSGRWGFNITLLLACEVTLAAVVGELGTLAVLFYEILGGGFWGWTAVAVASTAGVIVLYYFVVTVWYLVGTNWADALDAAIAAQRDVVTQTFGIGPNAVAVVPTAVAPKWKLP